MGHFMFEQYLRREYRNDIQGLRAVGALIIMFFHIWLNKVSGGVDVFFVISGFLMSSILLRGFFTSNIINPLPFWGGIIKRVAPSAYVVLLITLITSYYVTSPAYVSSVIKEVVASALHVENLQLMRKSVDYLASEEASSPVQQFWALSIQIQFYAILPFILLPLAYLSKRKGDSTPLFLGVVLIIVTSFIYAVVSVNNNAASSYFNPLSRVWEFFFGVLSFLLVSNISTIKYRQILGILGISLIVGGAVFIPRGAGFPSFVSFIPVLGAVLIIFSGLGGKGGSVNNILSSKFLVFLGGISFTIYLWHWPILVFYKDYSGSSVVGIPQGLAIIIASIVLAYFTSKKIEVPFKAIPREKVFKNFSVGVSFFTPVFLLALLLNNEVSSSVESFVKEQKNKPIEVFSGNKITLEEDFRRLDRQKLLSAKHILPSSYDSNCHQTGDKEEVNTCEFGSPNSNKEVVLVGGSHAAQWLPVLDEIGKDNDFKVISMTKSACPLGVLEDSNESCHKWNDRALRKILEIKPYAVITNSTRTFANEEEVVPESYSESWKVLNSNGLNVIGIRDNPRFNFDVPDCIHRNRIALDINACSVSRSKVLKDYNPANEYNDIMRNIDMSDMLCTKDKCLTSFSGKLMYRDKHHISVEYVYFMKNSFEAKLMDIL